MTNITELHKEAFNDLFKNHPNLVLISCFHEGNPAVAVGYVKERGDEVDVHPLFLFVDERIANSLSDHDGRVPADFQIGEICGGTHNVIEILYRCVGLVKGFAPMKEWHDETVKLLEDHEAHRLDARDGDRDSEALASFISLFEKFTPNDCYVGFNPDDGASFGIWANS